MLTEFDRLKRVGTSSCSPLTPLNCSFVQDYQEHQNEIHAKLVAIMGDRLAVHINSLQSIDWNTPLANPGINDYMEVLIKETVTLHKLLSRYLSVSVVEVSIALLVS